MSIAERLVCSIRFADGAWHFFVGDAKFPNGIITITEDGKFKARVLGGISYRWLSASQFTPLVPFETLADAKEALIKAILETRTDIK